MGLLFAPDKNGRWKKETCIPILQNENTLHWLLTSHITWQHQTPPRAFKYKPLTRNENLTIPNPAILKINLCVCRLCRCVGRYSITPLNLKLCTTQRQLNVPAVSPPRGQPLIPHLIRGWMGPSVSLKALERIRICFPCPELNRNSAVRPAA
jgi:hypothetical protein